MKQVPENVTQLFLRPHPHPAQLAELPANFADRVEIDTDRTTIPRGVWLRVTDHLIKRLQKKLSSPRSTEEQVERVTAILTAIENF